ncbi:MAG: hypothetical protein ACLFSB_15590, partial [Chitinispirillaceae bacterium]
PGEQICVGTAEEANRNIIWWVWNCRNKKGRIVGPGTYVASFTVVANGEETPQTLKLGVQAE